MRVSFEWNGGKLFVHHSEKTVSDAHGNFSLTGQQGERLEVGLNKAGYYVPTYIRGSSYDFFDPGNEGFGKNGGVYYYEADAKRPFIFRIRKKHEVATVLNKVVDVVAPSDGTVVAFDFLKGTVVPNDASAQLYLQTWKKEDRQRPLYPYDWRVILSIPDGGFSEQGAHQKFAFEAPTDGYTPTLDWPMHATGSSVEGHYLAKDLYFCFGQPKRYGHLHLLTDGSGRRIELSYSINLNAGDRNLETYPEPEVWP